MGPEHRPSRYRVRKADHRQRICHRCCPIHVLNLTTAADEDSEISNISSPMEAFDPPLPDCKVDLPCKENLGKRTG